MGVVSVDAYRVASHDVAVDMADQALYAAKNQGRDRYVVMDPSQQRTDPASTTVLPLRMAAGWFAMGGQAQEQFMKLMAGVAGTK